MRSVQEWKPWIPLSVCAFMLTACGSKSGGNDQPQPQVQPPPATYTVGGTVNGLLGTGLVLRNGTTDLPVNAAGNFIFPNAIATGTAFAVTVLTQPQSPVQVCTVANGSGTMGTAKVENIVVDCPAPALALVSVTPTNDATDVLTTSAINFTFNLPLDAATVAANVQLAPQGGNAIAVNASSSGANLSVVPQSALAPLTAYHLTVATGLRAQLGGQLSAPLTSTFTTKDFTWRAPQLISNGAANQGASKPQIAVGGDGSAVAVWVQSNATGGSDLWQSRYEPRSGWSAAAILDTSIRTSSPPQLAMGRTGNALVVWNKTANSRTSVWSAGYVVGTGWTAPALIEQYNGGDAHSPQVVFDGNDNAMAVWSEFHGATEIWSNRYVAGTGWNLLASAAYVPEAGSDALEPRLTAAADGRVAMAFHKQFSSISYEIWANEFTPASGQWSVATRIGGTAATTTLVSVPTLAYGSDGTLAVAWHERQGVSAIQNIWSVHKTSAGWGAPALVDTDDTNFASNPKIVAGANGSFHVAWFQGHLQSARYTIAGGWAGPVQVESLPGVPTLNATPALGSDASGRIRLLWEQGSSGRLSIYASRLTAAGGTWATPLLLESSDTESAIDPRIAVAADGTAWAVWAQQNGGGSAQYAIYAARLD